MKTITVHEKPINVGQIVNTIEGRARLDYIGRQSFTNWTLVDRKEVFPFGRPITVEDNYLDKFVLKN